MRAIFIVAIAVLLSGCEPPMSNASGVTTIDARFKAFEVKEFGLVCVSGGSGQLSCVKK